MLPAYDSYALEALNEHAAFYLMKPISIDLLIEAVAYVTEIKKKENALENTVLHTKLSKIPGKISVPQQDGFQVLNVEEILYCKADDNYTEIYLSNKKIVASKTLKHFEDALNAYSFVRIHKSYLVNSNEIVNIYKR